MRSSKIDPQALSSREKAKTLSTEVLKQKVWRAGALSWKLKPLQKRLKAAFHTCKSFLFVCLVARQSGKSFAWFIECVELCMQKKNARIRYGTAFQDDLEEFIIPIANAIFEDCPIDIKPTYKRQGHKFFFPNTQSELKLVGLDINPDGIRGNALDVVVIDEAGFVKQLAYVISIIIAMLRHRPQLRVVLSSSAPETPDHHFWECVDKAKIEGNFFEATIDDDETCTKETKDRIAKEYGGYDSIGYRRECLNERIVDADLAIVPEWKDTYIQEPPASKDPFYVYYHRYNSQDIGVVHFTVNLYGYYDFLKATFFVQDETFMKGPAMTTDLHVHAVKQKELELWGDRLEGEDFESAWRRVKVYRRISDNNNLLMLNDLTTLHNIHFLATSKDELPAMVNEFRLLVKEGRFIVAPKCKMLKGCLESGIYNSSKVKREFATSKVYGHYDALAAAIYLVRNLDQHSNPIPKIHGLDPHSHYIPPAYERNLSTDAQALADVLKSPFRRTR